MITWLLIFSLKFTIWFANILTALDFVMYIDAMVYKYMHIHEMKDKLNCWFGRCTLSKWDTKIVSLSYTA